MPLPFVTSLTARVSLGCLLILSSASSLANVSLSPASFNFGDVLVGTNADVTFVLHNGSATSVSLDNLFFLPSDSPLLRLTGAGSDCSAPSSIPAGGACNIRVRFSPNTPAQLPTTQLGVIVNGSALGSQINGRGVQPQLSIAPSGLYTFPPTLIGTTERATFTLSNTGSTGSVLRLGASMLSGNTAFRSSSVGTCTNGTELVGGGSSCTLQVRFVPEIDALVSGTLTVPASFVSPQFGSFTLPPAVVSLEGLGQTPPIISAQAGAKGLNRVANPGSTVNVPLTISNLGQATLHWALSDGLPNILEQQSMERTWFSAPQGGARSDWGESEREPAVSADHHVVGRQQAPIGGGLQESFDDISLLPARGWHLINRSSPLGSTSWFQGNASVFPAWSGPPNGYIAANFHNTQAGGTISNWLLTPEVALINGTQMRFRTRARENSIRPDRLQVRMSTQGASTNVGSTALNVGAFNTFLGGVNTNLQPGGYPVGWGASDGGLRTVTVSGLPAATTGRIALRYFVTDGGAGNSSNSDYIGIDSLEITQPGCAGSTAAQLPWLHVSTVAGTTEAGSPSVLTVSLNTSGLVPELPYVALLCIESDDPETPLIEVPVSLTTGLFYSGFGPLD